MRPTLYPLSRAMIVVALKKELENTNSMCRHASYTNIDWTFYAPCRPQKAYADCERLLTGQKMDRLPTVQEGSFVGTGYSKLKTTLSKDTHRI
jgi:hypothetical protein